MFSKKTVQLIFWLDQIRMLIVPYLAFKMWRIPQFQIKLHILVGDGNFNVAKNGLLISLQDWVEM